MMPFLIRKLLFLLFAGGLTLSSQVSAETDRARMREALGYAEKALAGTSARGDVIFLAHQGTRFTGRNLEMYLTDDIFTFRDLSPIEAAEFELWRMKEMPLPTLPRTVSIPMDPAARRPAITFISKDWEVSWVVSMMSRALSCKQPVPINELVGDPFRGYVAAHQVLSSLIARSRNCISDADFNTEFLKYVSRVYSEMLVEENERTDLHVERMALMALIGRIDLVPEPMLNRLIQAQWADGLWHYDSVQDHTTALAYVVISAAYGRDRAISP
jgi:hypothetical protein